MIFVENLLGIAQIVFDLGLAHPRQACQNIDVVAHYRGLGGHGRHELELLEFAFGFFQCLFWHFG